MDVSVMNKFTKLHSSIALPKLEEFFIWKRNLLIEEQFWEQRMNLWELLLN